MPLVGGVVVVVVGDVLVEVVTNPDRAKQVTLTISNTKLINENNNMIGIDTSSSLISMLVMITSLVLGNRIECAWTIVTIEVCIVYMVTIINDTTLNSGGINS
jgi:hypothetical protein